MTVHAAQMVTIDEQTDVREYSGDEIGVDGLSELSWLVSNGHAHAEPGLLGWWPHTHTLTTHDGVTYHARISDEAGEEATE